VFFNRNGLQCEFVALTVMTSQVVVVKFVLRYREKCIVVEVVNYSSQIHSHSNLFTGLKSVKRIEEVVILRRQLMGITE